MRSDERELPPKVADERGHREREPVKYSTFAEQHIICGPRFIWPGNIEFTIFHRRAGAPGVCGQVQGLRGRGRRAHVKASARVEDAPMLVRRVLCGQVCTFCHTSAMRRRLPCLTWCMC